MKKSFFTFMLAIVSSVWMTNEAGNWCMPSVRTLTEPWIEVNGTFQAEGFPCEPDEECPPCLTIVLVTSNKTYYLVTDDGQLIEQLDTIQLGTKATVSGIPFEHGSYNYIQVSHIETDQTSQLPSLCDEWNVWYESFESFGPISFDKVVKYQLTTDTLINGQQYVKLTSDKDSPYLGAMREGDNRDIYYVPAGSTHEYLLYAFNVQEGDQLTNLWIGGTPADYPDGWTMTVEAIQETNPRTFVLSTGFITTEEGVENYPLYTTWIEGVGSPETPYGLAVVPTVPADIGVYTLLCAYKNGEQIYVSEMGQQYGCEHNGIPSTKPHHLCDEWNIAKISNAFGPMETIHTVKAFLGSDTIIESQNYVKLIEDSKYKGALREGESGVIYYIPAGSAHEYLLYNFNAQVGDRLTNLWYGGAPEWCPNGYNATVLSISNETPRVFTIEVEYIITDSNGEHIIPWTIDWTEGIGLSDGPAGQFCPGPACACSCGQVLLCAYKNGEHIYTSDWGEQYGCEYNYDPYSTPADTIPLFSYTGDDPGSSTVDPVDPNQVVVTLKGDVLTVKETSGEEITLALSLTYNRNQMPALKRIPETETFRNEVTITLTEEGRYTLELTNPSWGYHIYGTFDYPQRKDAIDQDIVPTPGAEKIIRNGQLLIRKGEKVYTVQGTAINE